VKDNSFGSEAFRLQLQYQSKSWFENVAGACFPICHPLIGSCMHTVAARLPTLCGNAVTCLALQAKAHERKLLKELEEKEGSN
jgi:hypothetical protein